MLKDDKKEDSMRFVDEMSQAHAQQLVSSFMIKPFAIVTQKYLENLQALDDKSLIGDLSKILASFEASEGGQEQKRVSSFYSYLYELDNPCIIKSGIPASRMQDSLTRKFLLEKIIFNNALTDAEKEFVARIFASTCFPVAQAENLLMNLSKLLMNNHFSDEFSSRFKDFIQNQLRKIAKNKSVVADLNAHFQKEIKLIMIPVIKKLDEQAIVKFLLAETEQLIARLTTGKWAVPIAYSEPMIKDLNQLKSSSTEIILKKMPIFMDKYNLKFRIDEEQEIFTSILLRLSSEKIINTLHKTQSSSFSEVNHALDAILIKMQGYSNFIENMDRFLDIAPRVEGFEIKAMLNSVSEKEKHQAKVQKVYEEGINNVKKFIADSKLLPTGLEQKISAPGVLNLNQDLQLRINKYLKGKLVKNEHYHKANALLKALQEFDGIFSEENLAIELLKILCQKKYKPLYNTGYSTLYYGMVRFLQSYLTSVLIDPDIQELNPHPEINPDYVELPPPFNPEAEELAAEEPPLAPPPFNPDAEREFAEEEESEGEYESLEEEEDEPIIGELEFLDEIEGEPQEEQPGLLAEKPEPIKFSENSQALLVKNPGQPVKISTSKMIAPEF